MGVLAILWWLVIGLVVGALARLLIPGRQPMGLLMTMILGLIGSLVGGFLSWALFAGPDDAFRPAGFLMSLLGAVLVLGVYVMMSRSRRIER